MYAAKQAGRGQAFLAQHPSEDPSETAAA
jgi:hypothetical protein